MMNSKELQQKSVEELQRMKSELEGAIRDMRFMVLTRQHKKTHALADMKQDLARILTTLNAKQEPPSHV